jgi:hypothetical protein
MAVAATGSAVPAARSPWVISPWADSLFVIGAPLLIVPVLYVLSQFVEPIALAGFVLGAISTGHHFPGFVRTYADPVLFARYRFRLVVIPPLLFAAVFWFTWNDMHAVVLMVGIWGVWHGFMQIYGFMRIYDAKRGENTAWTARLDWLICAVGFVSILLWSANAPMRIIEAAEGSGLFFLPLLFGETARQLAGLLAGATAVVYVVYTAVQIHRGHPISPLKLLLLVVSMVCLFLSWVMAGTAVLLGLAVWEAFHDIQYEAIAWESNRRLALRPDAGPLLRRLYAPGLGLIVLYVIMCNTYGAIANGQGFSADRLVGALLFSTVLTSAIFHFYTDGFIWKVRQAKIRDDLGIPIANGVPDTPGTRKIFAGATHSRDIGHLILLAGVPRGARDSRTLGHRERAARRRRSAAQARGRLSAAEGLRGRGDRLPRGDRHRPLLGDRPPQPRAGPRATGPPRRRRGVVSPRPRAGTEAPP